MRHSRQSISILSVLCFCVLGLLCAGLLAGCDRGSASAAAPPARPAPPVTVAPAASRDVPIYLDEIGRIAARESVSLVPQVQGRVTAVHFTEGTEVKKGDLLFEIDRRPFEAAVAQAEATVNSAKANQALAKQQWANVEGLQAGAGVISKEEIEQRRSALAIADAQVKSGEAAVEVAKLNLEYCQVRSPIDGRTGQVMIDPGNVVKANEGMLVSIQRLDPVYTDFTVTERELQDVRQNMSNGTLRVEVFIPAGQVVATPGSPAAPAPASAAAPSSQPTTSPSFNSGQARIGALTFLDNAVQSGTGTVKLRATVANADHYFWPGQFVQVRLVLQVKKDAVLVPSLAVQLGQQGHYVFIVKDTGQNKNAAMMQIVKLGQRQGTDVVVEDGVSAGDNVVISGHMMIQPGMPVTVVPNGPPAGGGPSDPAGGAAKGEAHASASSASRPSSD